MHLTELKLPLGWNILSVNFSIAGLLKDAMLTAISSHLQMQGLSWAGVSLENKKFTKGKVY